MIYAIFFAIILVVLKILTENIKNKQKEDPYWEEYEEDEIEFTQEFNYKRKNLFTKTEFVFMKQLEKHTEDKMLLIFPKVRIADIVDVDEKAYTSEWMTAFNKINRKHVDFLICDKNTLHIKYIIELDDYTHKRNDRKARDNFVDEIMEQCGFEILHFPVAQEYDFSEIL